ncbi:hypothetical protein HWV62_35200 [Athelia sp. TMB]|nr:hypothetical protein HWV62_35200 [Athelia sp. TMB]
MKNVYYRNPGATSAPVTHNFIPSAGKKMMLSSRTIVDRSNSSLYSVQGAHDIIQLIKDQSNVSKLFISHNFLGDDGCEVLFGFLCSDIGRSRRITEVKLAKNGIGNRGLLAITKYLRDNRTLRELYIPANDFTPDPAVIGPFTAALNTSHVAKLNIGSHLTLSDAFIEHFIPSLASNHLSELQLSNLGLTYACIPHLVAYLKDRLRSRRLRVLMLNANNLGSEGLADLVTAIGTGNWSLAELEIFSNTTHEVSSAEQTQNLKQLLQRNRHYRRMVEKEALGLIRPSRALLLPPHDPPSNPYLPTEIYLHILSFLAPALSPAQQLNVFSYASSYTTLPALLPPLFPLQTACVPDPSNSSFDMLGGPGRSPPAGRHSSGCMDGCVKGIVCQREVRREHWLTAVACDVYELEYTT